MGCRTRLRLSNASARKRYLHPPRVRWTSGRTCTTPLATALPPPPYLLAALVFLLYRLLRLTRWRVLILLVAHLLKLQTARTKQSTRPPNLGRLGWILH